MVAYSTLMQNIEGGGGGGQVNIYDTTQSRLN